MGDNFNVGDLSNVQGLAIGEGATATVNYILPQPRPNAVSNLSPFNRNFVGRQTDIQQIAANFNPSPIPDPKRQPSPIPTVVTQAISGMGGVGKTQVALAYAHVHRDKYDIIWQLQADDTTALDNSIRLLATAMGLEMAGKDIQQIRQLVLSDLNTRQQAVLLIYDNADQIAARELRPYLPTDCHLLITSRRDAKQWGSLAKPLTLGTFTEAEGMAFWQRRLDVEPEVRLLPKVELLDGVEAGLLFGAEPSEGEKAQLLKLGQTLGWLPLAMEQAAAFMLEEEMDALAYLQEFKHRRAALWEDEQPPALYHDATVATTWQMAFDHAKETEGAVALLNLLSFFAPDNMPLTAVWDAADRLPDPLAGVAADARKQRKSVKALRTYSLLTVTDGKAAMHRLVQEVARQSMKEEAAQLWVDAAMKVLYKAYNFDPHDMETWAACGQLLPHVQAAVNLATGVGVESRETAYLNNEAGFYLQQFGDYAAALLFYEKALAVAKKVFEKDHYYVATANNNVGSLLQAMGKLEEALPFFGQALATRKKALGEFHPDLAIDYNNMGGVLQAIGKLEAALLFYDQSLTINKTALGKTHPFVASGYNNMGSLLKVMGKLEEALPFLDQALAIRRKSLGENHPLVASDYNNMGSLLQAMGKFEEAWSFYNQAFAITKKALGEDHPSTAIDYNNMGSLLQAMGELGEARPFYSQALAINKKALGADHPDTAYGYNNLAVLSYYEGDMQTAARLMRQALAIWEKALGSAHPQTQSARQSFAAIEAAL